jgi:predicted NACHT family NTPase
MSDDEYEYDYGSDAEEENYGSDGGEDGVNNGATEELIEIENAFYGMQNVRISSPTEECVRHLPPRLSPYYFRLIYEFYRLTEGDDLKQEDPSKAIEMFEKVVDLETKRGDVVKW